MTIFANLHGALTPYVPLACRWGNKCLRDMISTCEWGQTRRSAPTEAPFCRGNPAWLPLEGCASRKTTAKTLTNRTSKVHYLPPPPLGSPRFARGTEKRALRFPLQAGGTLRRGSSTAVFVNSGSAIGITPCAEANASVRDSPRPQGGGGRTAGRTAVRPYIPRSQRGDRSLTHPHVAF